MAKGKNCVVSDCPDPSTCDKCMELSFDEVFEDIIKERIAQGKQWGGAENDDRSVETEWQALIEVYMERMVDCMGAPAESYRADLVKIAALAVAAIESHDRRTK